MRDLAHAYRDLQRAHYRLEADRPDQLRGDAQVKRLREGGGGSEEGDAIPDGAAPAP